jgi:flagellar hook-basal body complex protein FliE
MAIRNIAMNAYQSAQMTQVGGGARRAGSLSSEQSAFLNELTAQSQKASQAEQARLGQKASFANTVRESLTKVNDLQSEKSTMVEEFASGERQNVHELMISLQKAGVAMRMTSAVRNKVLEAYKELSRMQF